MFLPTHFLTSLEFLRGPTEIDYLLDPQIEQAEKLFDQFCSSLKPQDYSRPPANSSIPPILHFIWLGSALPEKAKDYIETWRVLHPGWTIKIWTDHEVKSFLWSSPRSKELFETAATFSGKADLLRLEILYAFGGIYSDVDVICLKPFHDLCSVDFFGGLELNTIWQGYGKAFYVGNAIMGAKKGSQILKECIAQFTPSHSPEEIILKGGPGLISRVCAKWLSQKEEKILILPCSYLYPLPYNGRYMTHPIQRYISVESLAIHLWDQSWLK